MEPQVENSFVQIDETLVGRKPGSSAAVKARDLRRAVPLGFVRSFLFGHHTDERVWRKAANGERFVGSVLGRLPQGWHVFHDVPVGERGANTDHVVVGPAGAFTM